LDHRLTKGAFIYLLCFFLFESLIYGGCFPGCQRVNTVDRRGG
jgi:hypothetical protein